MSASGNKCYCLPDVTLSLGTLRLVILGDARGLIHRLKKGKDGHLDNMKVLKIQTEK